MEQNILFATFRFKLQDRFKSKNSKNILEKASHQLLLDQIAEQRRRKAYLSRKCESMRSFLENKMTEEDYEKITTSIGRFSNNIYRNICQHQKRKFEEMRTKLNNSKPAEDHGRYVKNLSDKVLTKEESNLLSKGLNFAVTPRQHPVEDIICCTESVCQTMPHDEKEKLLFEIKKALDENKNHNLICP